MLWYNHVAQLIATPMIPNKQMFCDNQGGCETIKYLGIVLHQRLSDVTKQTISCNAWLRTSRKAGFEVIAGIALGGFT